MDYYSYCIKYSMLLKKKFINDIVSNIIGMLYIYF